jgi:hypothetical protein
MLSTSTGLEGAAAESDSLAQPLPKIRDGETVGVAVRDFLKGLAVLKGADGIHWNVSSSSVALPFLFFRSCTPPSPSLDSRVDTGSERALPGHVRPNPWSSMKWNRRDGCVSSRASQLGCGQLMGQLHFWIWLLTCCHNW